MGIATALPHLTPQTTVSLSPSDFAFLWEECRRCYYLKVVRKFPRPFGPMPKIFTLIDGTMKAQYQGRAFTLAPGLAACSVSHADEWVESAPLALPGRSLRCVIRGRLDSVLQFEDGSYAVTDLKTASVRDEHIALYTRQLHAYAYALERAAPRGLALAPVERLGLLVFDPDWFTSRFGGVRLVDGSVGLLGGDITWVAMPRDDAGFLAFLDEVVGVLEQPKPPAPAPACGWCKYRAAGQQFVT